MSKILFTPFGEQLGALLKTSPEWSARSLSKRSGLDPSFVGKVVRGQRRPPLKHVSTWLGLLGVKDGPQKEALLDRAALEHSPPRIGALVRRLSRKAA